MCVESGYKTVTATEIGNCISALNRKVISYRAVRVYFGCLALVAIRDAARRAAVRVGRRPGTVPRYRVGELCELTGLSNPRIERELRSLSQAGILFFSESHIEIAREPSPEGESLARAFAGNRSHRRPIPVPRSVLRFLARSERPALGKTVLAYVLRGMSIDRSSGEVRGVGTVKASWIADAMKVSLRAAKAARRDLIERGFISKDTGSWQRKLNRDGAYFQVNLSWKDEREGLRGEVPAVVRRLDMPVSRIAPRSGQNCHAFAPPIKDKKTPYGSKNQKPCTRKLPGVSGVERRGEGPTLRDVQLVDIKDFRRTEALYRQAVDLGWVKDSEASFLNWVGAAVRAKSCRANDPVRVFLGIVRQGLWQNITDSEEERARQAINRYRHDGDGARYHQGAVLSCFQHVTEIVSRNAGMPESRAAGGRNSGYVPIRGHIR